MNMLLRLLMVVFFTNQQLKNTNKKPTTFTQPIHQSFRVLPHDLGWRDHLPNYRFFSFIELNIIKWLKLNLGEVIDWPIVSQEMVYIKRVKPLDKFTVTSQLITWDDKYVYFQHAFNVKNQLVATGISKIMLIKNQTKLSPTMLITGTPPNTALLVSWQQHLQQLKQHSALTPTEK